MIKNQAWELNLFFLFFFFSLLQLVVHYDRMMFMKKKNKNAKKKNTAKKMETVPRTMMLKLFKPCNTDWKTAGRALRSVHAACINAATWTLSSCLAVDREFFGCGHFDEKGNLILPKKKKGKGKNQEEVLDLPELPEIKGKQSDYNQGRARYPHVASTIISAVGREVRKIYQKHRFKYLIGKRTSNTYRNFSIPIHNQRWKLEKEKNGKHDNYYITLPLLSLAAEGFLDSEGNPLRSLKFRIAGGWKVDNQYGHYLEKIIKGKIKKQEIKITCDKNKKKWSIGIPYERPIIETDVKKDRVMCVHPPGLDSRGNPRFLTCSYFPKNQQPWVANVEFESVKKTHQKYERICKQISRKWKQDNNGKLSKKKPAAVGRGRKRALKSKEDHRQGYKDFMDTFCSQRAAYIIRQAINFKCGTIVMTNMTKDIPEERLVFETFPYFDLQKKIKDKAEENNIDFELTSYDKMTDMLDKFQERFDGK